MKITIKLLFFISLFLLPLSCDKSIEPISQPIWHIVYNAPPDINYNDIFFVDQNNGWVIGGSSKILHTTDGGNTWETQEVEGGKLHYLSSVHFPNTQLGYAVGADFSFIRTTNGGKLWIDETLTPLPAFTMGYNSVFFKDNQNGWLTNNKGYVSYTRDGGISWNGSNIGSKLDLTAVFFINNMKGWVIAKNHLVFHTTDGGISWNQQKINNTSCDSTTFFNNLFFINDQDGWIVSGTTNFGATIYHTTNGGVEWFCQATLPDTTLYSVYFADKNRGWVTGSEIFYTIDGGNSWQPQDIGSNNKLVSSSFVDDEHGWVLSSKGTIYKYEIY
jgi:photosystem II stability/assembly factor-like uncharacterized protein